MSRDDEIQRLKRELVPLLGGSFCEFERDTCETCGFEKPGHEIVFHNQSYWDSREGSYDCVDCFLSEALRVWPTKDVADAMEKDMAEHDAAIAAAREDLDIDDAGSKDIAAPVKFGLKAQGHLPTIEQMLAEGKPWAEIGQTIGWDPEVAQRHYQWYEDAKRGLQEWEKHAERAS